MDTHSLDEVRFRTPAARPRLLPGLAAATAGALFWGLLFRSPWIGGATLALAGIPRLTLRGAKAPFAAWLALAFLLGGTASAIALFTHHAALP